MERRPRPPEEGFRGPAGARKLLFGKATPGLSGGTFQAFSTLMW
jgi:hypothetical protein